MWAWRSEHCGKCGHRRADFFDEHGQELKDPPVWPAEAHCPGCELLHDWENADDAKDRRPGTYPYLAPLDDDEDVDGTASGPAG